MAVVLEQSPAVRPRPQSRWLQAWRRYSRNYFAVAGLIWVILFLLTGIIGPWIAPYGYADTDFLNVYQGPSWQHIMGTDNLGHDMFSQILWSTRFAIEIAFGATLVSFVIGVILGLWAGLAGGITDMLIMRLVDFMYAFPSYFLNLILVVKFGRGLLPILFAIGITGWAGYARLIRSLVLSLRNSDMVEAARALGASPVHIARKYVFPNVMTNMVVALAFGIPYDLTAQAALSVVGLGPAPPMPSFGNLVANANANILGYPWLLYFPAGIFALTLLSFQFVADGLQEALNPKGGN
ncbi:peptide ABC transporter permease [Alicyclobacillus cellulosilyticus]|uniref:Peptide ABC transporter permease n=1 Tax=Alicyclobacillus cellulosilyticus TaxID=1003997 RepID=A0A917K4D5_9BACL|nr:ABC transporter permease [Alicyclobacillus cellulosilyticus]GGI98473.1 peptide ABC transporter permease [Alicyclobacillus cellulosilyticus]